VIAIDPAGNASDPSSPWTVIVDTTAPTPPSIDLVWDDVGTPEGLNPGDDTDDNQPDISGSAEPFSTVTIYDNGIAIGSVQTDEFGSWSYTPDSLAFGPHSITVDARDAAGNTGAQSVPFDFNVIVITPGSGVGFDTLRITRTVNVGDSFDTGAWKITPIVGSILSTEGDGSNPGWANFPGEIEFSSDTGPARSLTIDFRAEVSDTVVFEFFDVGGNLIHTLEVPPVGPGVDRTQVLTVTMPDDQEFASFKSLSSPGNGVEIASLFAHNESLVFDSLIYPAVIPPNTQYESDVWSINTGITGSVTPHANNGSSRITAGVEYTLKAIAANSLTIDYNSANGVVKLEFFDADGNVIHTYDVPDTAGLYQTGVLVITMPGGQEFAGFRLADDSGSFDVHSLLVSNEIVVAGGTNQEVGGAGEYIGDETNDLFQIEDVAILQDAEIKVEGGAGIDTMVLTGADQVLNLTALTDQISSIEVIDITGSGNNTLNLSLGDVLAQGGNSLFTDDDSTQMLIKGNTGDVVNLGDLLPDGTDPGDWASTGTATVAGVTYNVYQHSSLDAQLLVQDGVTTNLV
jgi:hypothetical protein